jgi:hypothetical protein
MFPRGVVAPKALVKAPVRTDGKSRRLSTQNIENNPMQSNA